MYLLTIDIRPTAALTFRMLPGSILDVTTYPFVPPTTLSGFVRRLAMLAEGIDIPGTAVNDAPYYVLPDSLVALGAYPSPNTRGMIHRTHRKGVKDFTDTSFTRLRVAGKEQPTFQLHTWEYLVVDRLQGYIVADDAQSLAVLTRINGYGCKLGKEGFAYIESTQGPQKMQVVEEGAKPSTVVPIASLIQAAPDCPFDLYTLHRFVWRDNAPFVLPNSNIQSPVYGYESFAVARCPRERDITLKYFASQELRLPCDLVNVLRGGAS